MPDYLYNLPYIIHILCTILGIFVAMTIHSFTKASISVLLGDDTPKKDGRLTLNPIKHCEPIGFFLMMFLGFGWDRPVKINVKRYKNYRMGLMLISFTPIIVSILFGMCMGGVGQYYLLRLNGNVTPISAIIYRLLIFIARHSIALGIFNIIPIYPLDGIQILSLFLEPTKLLNWLKNEKPMQMLLIILLYFDIIALLFNPIINLLLFFV